MTNDQPAPKQLVHEFFSAHKRKQYRAGEYVIHPHEDPQYVFYVISGQVRQFDISLSGEEVVVNVFKQASFFPMSYVFTRQKNVYAYQAFTDLDVYCADAEDVLEFMMSHKSVLMDLLKRVYIGTDGLLERMVQLMGGDAESRLRYELLIQAKRFGSMKSDGTCFLSLTITELASRAGLTRETASRVIGRMRSEGMIKVSKSRIVIKDIEAFEKNIAK